MKVIVFVKATPSSEAGEMPSEKLLADMGNYNEELVQAGIMKAGEGLKSTKEAARVRFSGASRTVIDGPFAETKELVAGFWIWEVRSMQEASDRPFQVIGDTPLYSLHFTLKASLMMQSLLAWRGPNRFDPGRNMPVACSELVC